MLFLPAAAAAVGLYALSTRYDKKVQELDTAIDEVNRAVPISNRYQDKSKTAFLEHRQPLRIIPDRDLRGVPMYHVDWGSGVRTREYHRPNTDSVGGDIGI